MTRPPPRRRAGTLVAIALLLLLAAGIVAGIAVRDHAEATLAAQTSAQAIPFVQVVNPQPNPPGQQLILPGQTMAFIDTPIYARTSGYLKRWYFDIGAHVHKGELLADIDAPELDDQLRQARADLATARATASLAGVTARRAADLFRSRSVSTQERDNAAGALTADQTMVASRQADVARLLALQSYEHVYAPFDGVITARNTDIGDLITAGSSAAGVSGPASALFQMAQTSTLRIYVAVPERDAPAMRVGSHVAVSLDEFPGRDFRGIVARTDHAIDIASRTLTVEVDVDNQPGVLLPGAYAMVHFTLPGNPATVVIPANTLLFRSEGLRVGVVAHGAVHLAPITIGRDYGDHVEVTAGLRPGDAVIVNPSDSLLDGARVRVEAGAPPGAL